MDERGRAALMERLLEATGIVLWTSLPPHDGPPSYLSPSYRRVFGRDPDGVSQQRFLDVVDPADRARVEQGVRTGLTSGARIEPYRVHHPDGTVRWVRTTFVPVPASPDGEVVGYSEDVTEEVLATHARDELHRVLDRFLNVSPDVLFVFGPDFVELRFLGESVERLLGVPRRAFVDVPQFLAHIHPDDRTGVTDRVTRSLTAGRLSEALLFDYRIVRADGEVRWVWTRLAPVFGAAAAMEAVVGLTTDVTELRERDLRLRELHHRVKNNLQLISSLLYLRSRSADGDVAGVFDEMRSRIRTLAAAHDHLLGDGGADTVDVASFLGAIVEGLGRGAGPSHVRHRLVVSPETALPIARAIPVGLLVNELVTNALRHAFPEERPGTVVVQWEAGVGNPGVLTIEDDGVGLPTAHVPGFGSQLVALLVEQLDGVLEVTHRAPTRFRVSLRPPPR